MKGELVQVGRCRQLLQDRHLLERKEEEEGLRSKVAEVRRSRVFSFVLDKNRIRCVSKKPAYNSCVVSKVLADERRCGWHKLSFSHSPPIKLLSALWKIVFNRPDFEDAQ